MRASNPGSYAPSGLRCSDWQPLRPGTGLPRQDNEDAAYVGRWLFRAIRGPVSFFHRTVGVMGCFHISWPDAAGKL